MNPPIRPFSLSSHFFGSLLVLGYQQERESRSRPKDEHSFIFNLVIEKEARKDHDRRGSCITWPRIGNPMGFVHKFGLDFG